MTTTNEQTAAKSLYEAIQTLAKDFGDLNDRITAWAQAMPQPSSDQKATYRAAQITYRYVRCVSGNHEIATKETADYIGEYITDNDGLPQHSRDLPLAYAYQLPNIESAPEPEPAPKPVWGALDRPLAESVSGDRRTDFWRKITTTEPNVHVGVSSGDSIGERPDCLLQLGEEGDYACAYLKDVQVAALISGLAAYLATRA